MDSRLELVNLDCNKRAAARQCYSDCGCKFYTRVKQTLGWSKQKLNRSRFSTFRQTREGGHRTQLSRLPLSFSVHVL